MKTSRFIWRIFLVPLVTMLCAFFVAPLQAQGQSVEAYVQMSADKTTLTFFYDTKRGTREGTTWGVEKKKEYNGWQYPAWAGTYQNPNTTTTKAVVDASFKDFRPTSTAQWLLSLKALTNIEGLQYLNTSEVTNMSFMFAGCSSLTSLDLSSFNTEKVTDMRGMFSDCSALTTLDLKNFNTSNVTDMGWMFSDCYGLTVLDLSNFNTSNVTDMGVMFARCSALKSLDLKNFNTSNVMRMSNMFARCSSLTALDLKSFYTEKVTDMSGMFEGCSALTNLDLSNFNTSNVMRMSNMFARCSSLTALDLKSFYTEKVTDMRYMFSGCSALTNLDLKNFNTSNVTKMDEMFANCSAFTTLDLKSFNTEKVEDMSDMFKNCTGLTALDLKNFNTEKVEDMSYMFAGCSGLTSLDLSSFNTSNVTDMNVMFADCSGLTSLDLSSFNTEKVENMNYMFQYCSKLASIVSNKTWKSEQSQGMFEGCTALKGAVKYDASKVDVTMANPETGYFTKKVQDNPEVTTPEAYVHMSADKTTLTFFYDTKRATREGTTWGIEEKKEFEGYQYPAWVGTDENPDTTTTKAVVDASFKDFRPTSTAFWFRYFKALTAIEGLQNLNTTEVTDMGYMFYSCSAMISLDLKNFNTEKVTDMSNMFTGCKSLTTLDLKNFNTSNVTSMNGMFYDCSALTSLDLKSFNTEKVTDMGWMFDGCSGLKTIDLKNFNTSNVTSMSNMFNRCSALTSLDFKNFNTSNVTSMADMFGRCSALTSLDLKNFNTEKVEQMGGMFMSCSGLRSLDLKNFNTSNVTDMRFIFYGCSQLANIFSNKAWKCEQSQYMFAGCTALKGAVAYDESKTDATMANPETGYFTKKVQDKPEVTSPEAYVQMSADQKTLTFFYDTKRATREGTTWDITSPIATRSASLLHAKAWGASEEKPNSTTTKVVFDASFAKFYPKTTAEWFAHYAALKRIEGIENLNTSEVTSMKGMFTGCAALDTLDLTTFNTEKVNDMSEMFKNCANLSTVVCDKVWSTPHSEQMFYGCVKLLGKAAFDAQKTSVEMANPNSGYFVATKPTALLPMLAPARANGIYTLQGKRVSTDRQHLPAGVYIVNGKKVVVQ